MFYLGNLNFEFESLEAFPKTGAHGIELPRRHYLYATEFWNILSLSIFDIFKKCQCV